MQKPAQGTAQRVALVTDPDPAWTAERLLILDVEDNTWTYTEAGEVAERGVVPIGNPVYAEAASGGRGIKWLAPRFVVMAMARRDGVAVRVPGRVAQGGIDALFETVAQRVFEQLGFRVYLVPRHIEGPGKEGLEQTMPADHP